MESKTVQRRFAAILAAGDTKVVAIDRDPTAAS